MAQNQNIETKQFAIQANSDKQYLNKNISTYTFKFTGLTFDINVFISTTEHICENANMYLFIFPHERVMKMMIALEFENQRKLNYLYNIIETNSTHEIKINQTDFRITINSKFILHEIYF